MSTCRLPHHNDGKRDVDLEEVEAEGAVEGEVKEDDGPVADLAGGRPLPIGPVNHDVLGQAQLLLHRKRLFRPLVPGSKL